METCAGCSLHPAVISTRLCYWEWIRCCSPDKMLEHTIPYLQSTISFLIDLVRESIPNKFQSAGLLLVAVGINIPNRTIISGLQCRSLTLCTFRLPPPLYSITRSVLFPVFFSKSLPPTYPEIAPSVQMEFCDQVGFWLLFSASALRRSENRYLQLC